MYILVRKPSNNVRLLSNSSLGVAKNMLFDTIVLKDSDRLAATERKQEIIKCTVYLSSIKGCIDK